MGQLEEEVRKAASGRKIQESQQRSVVETERLRKSKAKAAGQRFDEVADSKEQDALEAIEDERWDYARGSEKETVADKITPH